MSIVLDINKKSLFLKCPTVPSPSTASVSYVLSVCARESARVYVREKWAKAPPH